MAEQFYTILTNIGKAKIANASALGNKVNFTHFALGDGNGSYYNPTESQTTLKKEVWRGTIGQIVVDENNPNWIVLETVIPTDQGGFTIREAGVFDSEGNLLAIGKYPETYKPQVQDGSAKDLYIRMILEVANTSVVNLKVDPSIILATKKDMDILSNRIAKNEKDIINNQNDIKELRQGSTTIEDLQTENKTLAGAINELENNKASKDYVRDYTDSQIALVTETGIPKLNRYEYKFHNVAIGTTEIQIPLESFDNATDTVKLYINAISRDSDFFNIIDNKIILNQALQQVSKITLEVWKNVPIGPEGSVSGIVIAPDSMPQNRVQGLADLSNNVSNHLEDYEYQEPIIVDRQIHLQKLSNTRILKFRLDTDITNGTQITISTDNGETSKPLVDFEGMEITELEKGFLEVVESPVNFTLRPRGANLEFTENVESFSEEYEGTISAMADDDEYIYCAVDDVFRVFKIRKSDMTKVSQSISYGSTIEAIAVDGEYVYCTGRYSVWKIRKSTMARVLTSSEYDYSIRAILEDGNYIYIGGNNGVVRKLSKANLTIIAESAEGNYINALAVDDVYIYTAPSYSGSGGITRSFKIRKSDMVKVSESSSMGTANSNGIAIDETYVFIGSGVRIRKLRKSSMIELGLSSTVRTDIQSVVLDSDYVYSSSSDVVIKNRKSDLLRVAERTAYNGHSRYRPLLLDGKHLYDAGVNGSTTILISNTWMSDYYTNKNQILIPMGV